MGSSHLTKSRYFAGLQCLRRLWLLVNEPPDYEEPPPGSPTDIGQVIGQKAHLLFPGGILVEEEPWEHAEAVIHTAALMADLSVPAIFEAAFEHVGVRVRVDVLERLAHNSWGLREVKGSSRVKDHYLDDLAIQTFVVRGAGVPLTSIQLMHVNTGYVRGKGDIEWPEFFAREDLDEMVAAMLLELPGRLPGLRDCLGLPEAPVMEPGSQCSSPFDCEFWDQCTANKPADWIVRLPRLRQSQADELKTMGIESISAIPPDFPLSCKQAIIRDATASGKPFVSPDLGDLLKEFGPPAAYLDFEAMNSAIPLYEGTRPYQAIPFQWSLHVLDEIGQLSHRDFLALGDVDPRRSFAESLIEALGWGDVPIIVYSAYEKSRLNDLADLFPDLRPALEAIISRLADLLPVVRAAVYHPDFDFSNSIKNVGPALCPGFGYDDLDGVSDGLAASAAFVRLASDSFANGDEAAQLRRSLLAYCERDTLAMVEVHRALRRFLPDTVNLREVAL